jgi:hypothetical protein
MKTYISRGDFRENGTYKEEDDNEIEKKKFYRLIAYKASSEDYCRGCLMASYSSDLIDLILTQEELVDRIAKLQTEPRGNGESNYEFIVLKNAQPFKETNKIIELVEAKAQSIVAQREQLKIKEQKAADQAKEQAKIKAEQAEYERLKNKFEKRV